ncbi:MAG: serine/threonine protein kinase [Clostridia bacterium]|nr:serine/threonine protein kinase [Clostridia bacterium]
MTNIGTVIDGKYEILKEIGRGGMSVVYLAMDKHLNKQWAVKEIRKKGNGKNDEIVVNSLLAEANMMKKLDHPALPRIVDIIDNGVTIYVVMDYIEGESLDKVLNEHGVQPEELVIAWAKQLCDALSYLHSQKPPIIYRDMKPANVMLKPEGNIKIIDFGIAREYKEQNLADTTVLGTKGFAPPEQYSGQTDARSDIYALGMTMHNLLTGVDPRNSEAYVPVRQWNPELSEGIELIIDKCVQPAAENRYQTCADLLYDLEHPTLITKGFKRIQKRKLLSFVISAALSVVMFIMGFTLNSLSSYFDSNLYDGYISTSSTSEYDIKIENYAKAISIYPGDTRAYIKLLEAYEDRGIFTAAENGQFLGFCNANREKFDKSSLGYAELYYKLGMLYYNYYINDKGEASVGDRVRNALGCFSSICENEELSLDFQEKDLADCFYVFLSFYKTYVLNEMNDPSKKDYEDLFTEIENCFSKIEVENQYNQLVLYCGVFRFIYDQRAEMSKVNVEVEKVLGLFEDVYSRASNLSVQKKRSTALRDEIVQNYDKYVEAINRTYSNKKVRG